MIQNKRTNQERKERVTVSPWVGGSRLEPHPILLEAHPILL